MLPENLTERKLDIDFNTRLFAIKLVLVIAVTALVFLWRPLFHPIIYRIAYSPGLMIGLGIPIFLGVLLFLAPPIGRDRSDSILNKLMIFTVLIAVFLILGMLIGIPAAMFAEKELAQQTMDSATEIEEFPEINEDNARVVPRDVSDVQTSGSVSYRMHTLGSSDIARMEDGSLGWSYALEPDDVRNKIYENQRGLIMADMTSMDNRSTHTVDDQDFEVGEGMWLHRSADWNMKKGQYWSQYNDDPIEFTHDGDAYMAYPKTGHEWNNAGFFTLFTIPILDIPIGIPYVTGIPFVTPVWDGVALVETSGDIHHLTPEEAQESEILEGQRLYPLDLTEREMESLGYREGIVNQMSVVGSHENQVEIASMPSGAGNTQPFVIDLEGEQMSYVTVMEPYGSGTTGLDEVWFADATTGEYRYYGSGSETLMGPERAMGLVRSEDTQTGWGDDFEVVEPIPVTIDDELWWHSKVVPIDYTDVSRNVFVNAHTNEAVEVYGDSAIRDFLAGEDPDEAVDIGDGEVDPEPSDDPDVTYEIVIYDENGDEVDRIEVGDGEYIEIRSQSDE